MEKRKNGEKKNRGKEEKRNIRKGRLVPTYMFGGAPLLIYHTTSIFQRWVQVLVCK